MGSATLNQLVVVHLPVVLLFRQCLGLLIVIVRLLEHLVVKIIIWFLIFLRRWPICGGGDPVIFLTFQPEIKPRGRRRSDLSCSLSCFYAFFTNEERIASDDALLTDKVAGNYEIVRHALISFLYWKNVPMKICCLVEAKPKRTVIL